MFLHLNSTRFKNYLAFKRIDSNHGSLIPVVDFYRFILLSGCKSFVFEQYMTEKKKNKKSMFINYLVNWRLQDFQAT